MPAQSAGSLIGAGGPNTFPVLCSAAASTGGLRSTTGALLVFHGTDGILIEARPDREYAKQLIEAETAFWQLVKENRWPELTGEELDLSADPEWRSVALRYREVRLRLECAAFEEHNLRATLTHMATARRTYGCGVEVLKSSRKGAVDY